MSSDPKNLIGVTLAGRYRIEKAIGEGGMGTVFLATQLSLGRPVAIKVVKPQAGVLGATPHDENMQRFERETEVIARLAHPNIVQVVDAGRADDGTLFLAMELLEGDNVRQALRRERSFPIARALAVVEDVASALVAAHQGGVIHRDLKAENVMLVTAAGKDETAKVLDFGVAKLTSQTAAPPMTGSGFVAGTPGCIAPEQMLGKTDDPRSDLYSVGVLLFEMLTGQPPFQAANAMELMLKHLQETAPRASLVARQYGFGEVPPALDALVASLLAKDPGARPPDARTLRDVVRGMRDAGRATVADIDVAALASAPRLDLDAATRVGSRVVAAPPAVTSPTPAAPAAPAPPAPPTAPTVAMPPAVAAAAAAAEPRRRRPVFFALRGVAVVVVVAGAIFACRQYEAWRANEVSHVPEAKAAIERAQEDFWNLDLEMVEDEAEAALAADPTGAPWASILKAGAKLAYRRPLARVDADLARARAAADRRMSVMVERTPTSGLIQVLTTADPTAMTEAARAHCRAFVSRLQGCSALDAALITQRVLVNSGSVAQIEEGASFVPKDRPLGLWLHAALAQKKGDLDEAHRLLEEAERMAPGRPTIVDALVDVELQQQGKRDVAVARLEKLAARDDGLAIRLATLRARGDATHPADPRAFDAVVNRVQGLPAHDPARIDELASIGMHLASLGRFGEAERFWKESIDDRVQGDPVANARAAELASVAVLMSLVAGDRDMAARWVAAVHEIPPVAGPGADRLAAFLLAAGALMKTFDEGASGARVEEAKGDLRLLEHTPNDIPVIATTVRFYIAMREGRLDDALRFANQFSPCFRARNLAIVHLARKDLPGAARALDDGLTPQMERLCTTGDDTVRYIEAVGFAQGIGERAGLAHAMGDDALAKALLARFHAFWPEADPPSALVSFDPKHPMGRVQVELLDKALPR